MGKNLLKKVINKKALAAFALASTMCFTGFSFASCKDKTAEDETAKYTRELEGHYGDILLQLNKISDYKITEIHYVDAETVQGEKEVGKVKVYAKATINSKGKTADYSFTFTGDAKKAEEIKTTADSIFNTYYEENNKVTTEIMEMAVDYVAEISDYVAEYKKDCEVTKESVATVYLQDGEVEYDGYGVLNRYFDYLGEQGFLGVFESMNLIEIIADKIAPKTEETSSETTEKVTNEQFAELLKKYNFRTEIKAEIIENKNAETEEVELEYRATLTTTINGLSFVVELDLTDEIEATETNEIIAEINAKALAFLKENKVDVSKIKSVKMVNVTAKTVWVGINNSAEEAKLTNGQETAPEV